MCLSFAFVSMIAVWRSCVAPRVRFESEKELSDACMCMLDAYIELVHRAVSRRIRARADLRSLEWTEMDRLMLGIASFDEIVEQALPLVLVSTKGDGALYAHDLNTRVMRCINRHNFTFFHETTSVCEEELLAGLSAMLWRVLITSHQSHYHALLGHNFAICRAWDGEEWLLCPRHRVGEYEAAIRAACTPENASCCLNEDLVLRIVELLGVPVRAGGRTGPPGLAPGGRLRPGHTYLSLSGADVGGGG